MKYVLILLVLMANQAFAQSEKQRDLTTSIKNVTVFLQGAQISREGKTHLKKGRSTIIVKSLSSHIDAKSIQVKGAGPFTILSVNHNFNYLDALDRDDKIDSLFDITKDLEHQIATSYSRIEVLKEKQSLLNANKKLGGENLTASIAELKLAVDFYDRTLMDIKSEELQQNTQIKQHNELLGKIRSEIREYQNYNVDPTSEIKINIEADVSSEAEFTINYIVANAGWYPKYDLRVKSVENPLALTYKAEVYQHTGVDWKNVKLKFSNGNPNQSGVAPKLTTWRLNYQRNTVYQRALHGMNSGNIHNVSGIVMDENNEPMPGVNIVIEGSTIGTVTDVAGNYSLTLPNDASNLVFSSVGYSSLHLPITSQNMNINMSSDVLALNEVVATGYSSARERSSSPQADAYIKQKAAKSIITTTLENQTTVEFEVETPYTIKSNGDNLTVNLNTFEVETLYEYYAVPKLEKDAFLIARIINWDQFDLLEGEANLYFEDSYVGRSILNAKALTDTLDISLGRDKNIIIGREKSDTFTKRTSLGSNKVETRGFDIVVRNKKSQSIHLTIFDQIPVPAINTIEIEAKNISGGILDEQSGVVTWKFNLEAQSQSDLKLIYEVKYPKRESINLE